MAHFKRVTSGDGNNAVIMGRKTWDSIPPKFRPLPGRTNVVLTRSGSSGEYPDNVLVASSLQDAVAQLEDAAGDIFVIGGAQVYQESIDSGLVNRVVYTEVSNLPEDAEFDAFFPKLDKTDWECCPFGGEDAIQEDAKSGLKFQFLDYTRVPEGDDINPEEMQYLQMCRDIIENGVRVFFNLLL